jgi:hypothetical protein
MVRKCVSCAVLMSSMVFAEHVHEIPAEWDLMVASSRPITVRRDFSTASSGSSSALLASEGSSTTGFGVLMQATVAAEYREERVRFSGDLKGQELKNWAGLWLHVLDASGNTLVFDNMQSKERRMPADSDWQRYDIVIDIPARAAILLYGVTLNGTGKFWADGLRIEIVDQSTPVTASYSGPGGKQALPTALYSSPRNLDFER